MKDKSIIIPGKWYVEIDEKTHALNAVYDQSYYDLLGELPEKEKNKDQENWMSRIHPDDVARVGAHTEDVVSKHPEGKDYDIEYRMLTASGYRWFHDYAHCTRKEDGSLIRSDGVIIDIQDELDREEFIKYEQFKAEMFAYLLEHDEDPIEMFKGFAERMRVLIDCDQVIYRDLEETRIMVNSPAIEKTWSVPIEYCQQCEHFDAHHPMYSEGYTEMDNCQKGWKGIPVYKDCPIKSSLTRLIFCDEEIAGYLAIHYVQKYHTFTDLERTIIEDFARVLSLTISRYEAKKTQGELNSVKKTLNMTFALSDQFDPIIVVDPETGEYDWLMSVADDVVDNTSMTLHGDDLYKNIGIDGASIIHKEDQKQFKEFYSKKNLMKIAKTGETQEIENRWFIQTEGRYKWKYNKAVRMVDDNGKVYVIVGVIDTTESKEKEEEYKQQQKLFAKQLELVQNASRFFALEDTFVSLYDIELETGHYLSYDGSELYQNMVRDKLVHPKSFFENMHENIERVVFEDDQEETYNVQQKDYIIKTLSKKEHIDHYYRIKSDDSLTWFKMRIVYKDADKKNIIIGIFNADEEMAKKEKEERIREELVQTNARLFALEDNFESLYDVEMESGHYDVFVKGDFYKDNVLDKLTSEGDFFLDLNDNIDEVIYEEDREKLHEVLTRKVIKKELAKNDFFDYYYRLNVENTPVWFKLRVVYKGPEKKNIIVGVFNASEDIEAKQIAEQKSMLEEALTFTNFFLDTYVSAYYVDFKNNTCQVYKRTDELEENYPIMSDYFDSLMEYIQKDVHPDDRDELMELARPEKMKKLLSEKKEYSHIFRDISDGIEKTYRMQVIRGAEENHAAFGFIDISEEIQLQKSRQAEEEETRKLIDSIAGKYNFAFTVSMANDEFKIIKLDPFVKEKLEFTSMESYEDVLEPLFKVIHPDDVKRMEKEFDFKTIRKHLKKANTYSVEYRVLTDKATNWHEMNITLIDKEKELVAMGFEEKDLEITQKHLEDKRYAEYFALYEIDVDTEMMKIVKDSPYYGLDRAGKAMPFAPAIIAFASGLDDEPREFFERFADLEYAKERFEKEDKITYAYRSNNVENKSWVDCTCYVTKRHDDGSLAMFTFGFSLIDSLGVYRQELQQKYVEQNAVLVSQQEQLEVARDEAESANKSKTDFLFSMSHDIRTPMNAIMGFTNMAIKHIDDKEKAVDCLEKTQKAGTMLLSLINSVLEVSRIESGHAIVEEQPGDVYLSFVNIENTMREMANTKDIDLSFEFGDIKDRFVYTDFSRCMRIFVNIISNAIKYTQNGGYVKVRCEQVGNAKNGVGKYRYVISDNGIGMSDEFQNHIFEQFSRENTSTVSGVQGSGLGMSVVKSFVDLMGGTITVQSQQGEGSTFTIVLPFKLQEHEEYIDPVTGKVIVSSRAKKENKKIDFTGRKVLLVEDNDLNREIAIDILEEEKLVVDDVNDGTVAVEKLKEKGPDYYDFILMDIQMPVMNGYEAAKIIREMYPDKHIPIIALSANAFAEDKEKSLNAGMDDHVAKPINSKELFNILSRFLK